MISAAIIGGSGYTGGELARLLCRHPEIRLKAMTSRQHAGIKVGKVHPFLNGFVELNFTDKLRGEMILTWCSWPPRTEPPWT